MKLRAIAAMACVLAACDSPTIPDRNSADIYEFRLQTVTPSVLRWPTGTLVRVYHAQGADAQLNTLMASALEAGISAWNSATLFGEIKLEQTADLQSADAVVLFSTTSRPIDLDGCPTSGANASTTFCIDDTGDHLQRFPSTSGGGRTKFLISVLTQLSADPEYVRRLVAHELGHVLGIGAHSNRSSDLMYGGILTRSDPGPADRATLQLLYHTQPDITP